MDIYAFLDRHGIAYRRFDHPAVFTCEQAAELRTPMPGKDTKNLFLRDEKGKRHFLVTVGHTFAPEKCPQCACQGASVCKHEKQVDIKALKKIFDVHPPSSASADYGGVKKLSFASPDRLKNYLGVEPGAVTILGLIHDPDHAVEVFVDEAVWNADAICCHPLVNTATLCIPHAGLEAFMRATGHVPNVLEVPGMVSS